MVWAIVGPGRQRRVRRDVALAEGWEIAPTRRRAVAVPASSNYRLSVEEREKLYLQTGQRFEDHAAYKRWCRATGHRDIEKGEAQDESRRIFRDWISSGATGRCPLKAPLTVTERQIEDPSVRMQRMQQSGELARKIEQMGLRGRDTVRF